ncbi:hypothetical protein ACFL4Z_01225 [candidate division KSB1 bacterium]
MFRNNVLSILLFFILVCNFDIYGQVESFKKFDPKKKDLELYVTFSTSGGGAGTKIKWGDRENIQRFISFEISGVRGENEYTYYDPYYGLPVKMNQERYIFLVPIYFGLQKRLFKDEIEDDFRPFLDFEFGPVFGARFPVGNGLFKNIEKGKTGVTLGGFLGAGVEFGEITKNVYLFSLGYRVSYFFKKLEDERDFSALAIRLGIITQF